MSQVAGRALDLLVAVLRSPRPLGLMELAELTGIDKSTSLRLLGLLVEREFLARDSDDRRYQPGAQTYGLMASLNARTDIRSVATAHLAQLQQVSGETVSLHLRVGARRVCVDGAESDQPVRRVVPMGEALPLYLGPSGKVMLAHLSEHERSTVLAEAGAEVDLTRLRAQLAELRQAGYALTVSDRTVGVRAISAAVFGPRGPVASITIAGPSQRWTHDDAAGCVAALLDAAAAMSTAMGGTSR